VASDDAPSGGSDAGIDAPVDAAPDAPGPCNVLTQTGCSGNARCTYLNEGSALGEMCEPMGTAGHGSACSIDQSSGIDNCMAGDVCAGTCKPVCNTQGADTCGSAAVCNSYQHGVGTIGACDKICDPLNDNDFDGPASAHNKNGATVCTAAMQGCYGTPVQSGSNHTVFTCANDINYAQQNLHNKDQCTTASNCAGSSGSPYLNGCNQGYEPLVGDQTGMTTVYCSALCKPANCFQGNCGANNSNQVGVLPHRCNNTDALGSFNSAVTGEECTYFWFLEVDPNTSTLDRSPYSDSLGFCLDHALYRYDSNNDGTADAPLPACSSLPLMGTGVPPVPFGAVDLGCVDTATGGITRQPPRPLIDVHLPYHRFITQ
jgi:hypothetical protein